MFTVSVAFKNSGVAHMIDPSAARSRLALALDVDDAVHALALAKQLQPWFSVAKVGLELFSAAGPDAIVRLVDLGFDVFLDLKLHDIPTTVHNAAKVVGSLGAKYLTIHAMGGADMLAAGVEGFRSGAELAGLGAPIPLAVTVLTSDAAAPRHVLTRRLMLAMEVGAGGIVCAAEDLAELRQLAPRMVAVVPGIRLAGTPQQDQARSATPQAAIAGGADLLVIGRSVTQAPDPAAAADEIASNVTEALERREASFDPTTTLRARAAENAAKATPSPGSSATSTATARNKAAKKAVSKVPANAVPQDTTARRGARVKPQD